MLRRRSLTVRAALIFVPIYVMTFLAGLLMLSSASLSFEEDHHVAPNIAIAFAADDMRRAGDRLKIAADGPFAELAAQNPSLWLLAESGGRRYSFGPVPRGAYPLFDRYAGILESGKFHVPGVARPFSDSSIERRHTAFGSVLIAAGGVDSRNVSFAHTFRFFLDQGLFVVLLALGVIGLVAMLVALPVLTAALGPVTADVAAIRPDTPGRRLREARVPRELLPLVRGFNSALDRLASEIDRRKRFIADVAHELRTPLAIISLQVDSLKDEAAKDDLRRVVTRLSHLVGQMLDVERLPLGGRPYAEIDLARLASDVVADMAPMAMASGYELSLAAPDHRVVVQGDPHALARAIGNLIGNAVAHAGGKGRIRVVIGAEGILDVVDEGPGVSASLRLNLFEPFCRERWDRDGCGLGLHLTREIMRAHGGDAVLLQTERGAAFRLDFRRTPGMS
jgi:signal transduction histidine kinase